MRSRIAIYGAGGLGKEVKGMLEGQERDVAGFIDDFKDGCDMTDDRFDDVLVAIADPAQRISIVNRWNRKTIPFNNFISNDIILHSTVSVGRGSILCPGCRLTVDISVGKFVIVNLNTTLGHDVLIGDFCSLMPSVNISGNVKIGDGVFIGTGAIILQGLSIGNNAVIGAGSVVTHDVAAGAIVKGVPAREKTI